MNNLMAKEIQMTSKELAEITGKQHAHIMRDIRNEIDALGEISESIFGLAEYQDEQGKPRPYYSFGRDGAMQLALKYDALTRRKVIVKLEELENRSQPSGEELIALAVIEAYKVIERRNQQITQLKEENSIMKPKALFADAVTSSSSNILIGELAKILKQNGANLGQNRLFNWMRDNGYLIKRRGTDYNMPTQKAMELGLFKIKESTIIHGDGHTTLSKTTKVTGKGQVYFVEKLNQDFIE